MSRTPAGSLPPLTAIPGIEARFLGRIPGVEVSVERHAAMALLAPYHRRFLQDEGLGTYPLVTAEQVHGDKVAMITQPHPLPVSGADGLITRERGVTLGIYVADCAPVWIVARNGSAGALLHSGKKGTELGIVPEAIRMMGAMTQLSPSELILLIGPCIRPPCYEVDFAGEIRRQAETVGISEIHDDKVCTACHPEHYYSYRREHGFTGRMLATLTLLPS